MSNIEEVFNYWKTTMQHERARLDAARSKVIKARLENGYSVEDLKMAIDGCAKSDFHMGQNSRGQKYDAITLILRDADHVDKFLDIAQNLRPKPARLETFRERDARLARERFEEAIGVRQPENNVIDITPVKRMERIA